MDRLCLMAQYICSKPVLIKEMMHGLLNSILRKIEKQANIQKNDL